MTRKTFGAVRAVSLTCTVTAAVLSIVGIPVTGFYPGIPVLCLLVSVPLVSGYVANRIMKRSGDHPRNYFTLLTLLNVLVVLVVLWMSFVILHDRVLKDGG